MSDGTPTTKHVQEAKPKHQAAQPVVQGLVQIDEGELCGVQRAVQDPAGARPGDILALQRAAGNRAVSRLIQAKLTVGPADDRHEQEADRVAEQVLSMPPPVPQPANGSSAQRQPEEEEIQTKPLVQRQEDEEELQMKPLVQRQEDEEELQMKPLVQRQEDEEELQMKSLVQRQPEEEELQMKPLVQRQPEEEELQMKPLVQRQEDEEELQMKPLVQRQEDEEEIQARRVQPPGDGSFEAGADVERRLDSQKGGGQPLPDSVRSMMEPRFGADFSGVRVHTGSEAADLNRSLSAQAFTHGNDIYLGGGRYQPGTTAGKRLLAHELTHVIQQGGGKGHNGQLKPLSQELSRSPEGVQRWGFGKKKTDAPKLPPTGKGEQAYIEALIADASLLSPKEQELTGQRPPLPSVGNDPTAYVKTLQANPSQMSEKERALFGLLAPAKEEEQAPTVPAPSEPGRWEKFKGKFAKKPKTTIELIADQLESEFKGYSGLKGVFTRTRKSEVTQEAQSGVLTPAQERNIDALAALDPEKLKSMGFLLPDEAQAKAKELQFKPEEVGKLPVKQQMQIITFQSRFEISRPQPATESEQRKLDKLREGPPQSLVDPKSNPPGPSSQDIILKAGKGGEETATHNVDAYRDIAADMVEQAGVDHATIGQTAEILITDYVDVEEGKREYHKAAEEKKLAEALASQPTLPKDEKKSMQARLERTTSRMQKLLKALHEPDFDKAEQDARFRAESSQDSSVVATQEKATLEYAYDEVEKKKAEVHKRRSQATRKQKKDATFQLQMAQEEKAAADKARGLVQQARMSFGVLRVRRRSTDDMKNYVQVKLDRIAGTVRKLLGTIVTGALSAGVGFLTFGTVGIKAKKSAKGYMGEGMVSTGKGRTRKGAWMTATFFNDIRNQIAQFKTAVTSRPSGPSALDVTSAILRGFNEIVVQNVINIAGKLAFVTGILAALLTASAFATFGGTAPAAAVLATISSIATFVALIAAALKAAVSLARATIDGLAALLNQDAKLRTFLKSRAKQSGMETMSDVTQLAGSAIGTPTGQAIKGGDFVNMFDPKQIINMNVGNLTRSVPLGTTIGATVTSTTISTVAPAIMGPVAQGIKSGVDEPYALYTQHPDERGARPSTKAGGGFLPPSNQRGRLEAQSRLSKDGSGPVDPTMPGWMQIEMEKQNKLRSDAYKGRSAVGVGQLTAVTDKSSQVASKLGSGKTESEKLDAQLKDAQGKGNQEVDEDSLKTSREQTAVLDDSTSTITATVEALDHGKREMVKLAEEQK